jgi:hypothetical protein
MNAVQNPFEVLAGRAGKGDEAAAARLRSELEPHLQRIVRRTIRAGGGHSALTRQILSEARRLEQPAGEGRAGDSLVERITRRVADAVLTACPTDGTVAGVAQATVWA